jgi:hypothetical protein
MRARCPNDHHHSIGKKSDRLQAGLAIISSCVLYVIVGPANTIDASAKFKPLSRRAAERFAGSNVIFTLLNVPPFNYSRQGLDDSRPSLARDAAGAALALSSLLATMPRPASP